jgi:hypothetical protein
MPVRFSPQRGFLLAATLASTPARATECRARSHFEKNFKYRLSDRLTRTGPSCGAATCRYRPTLGG